MGDARKVTTRAELPDAAGRPDCPDLLVAGDLDGLPAVRLAPGQALRGGAGACLRFVQGADGVQIAADSVVSDLRIVTDPDRRAVFNDTQLPGFGRLELARLRVSGCVRILAEAAARGGHIDASDIDVEAADAAGWDARPSGFGVEVIPGAFTIWNRRTEPDALVTADLVGIAVGRPGRPVRGGGVFVGGTPDGGRTVATRLETAGVHSHGGIAPGTADRISGGVFLVSGAHARSIHNRGPVTTYGPNDMVLDNWGSVESWRADAPITSHGPSAIGFVNFGALGTLVVEATIETFGVGARGFNVYDGTLGEASFERIATHGDGAVGIQISRPVGRIVVKRGVETFGGVGDSLVKGVVTRLAATPLSVKPGGLAREIRISGGVVSHGDGVAPLELHGAVERFTVEGGFEAAGGGFAVL